MSAGERLPLAWAQSVAEMVRLILAPFCERIEVAGSVRREAPMVGDIELVAIPKLRQQALTLFDDMGGLLVDALAEELDRLVSAGEIAKGRRSNGQTCWGDRRRLVAWPLRGGMSVAVDLWCAQSAGPVRWALPAAWGWQMVHRTGPADWAHQLVTRQSRGGLCPDDCELKDGALWRYVPNGVTSRRTFVPTPEEADLLRELGLPYLEPTSRFLEAPEMVKQVIWKDCPVKGCGRGRRPSEVVCSPHWKTVPRPLRDEVWRLFRTERGSLAHLVACREVVRFCEEQGVTA